MRRDVGVVVELLAHVGAGREAHVVGGGEDEDADRLVAARHRQVLEQLAQHLRVDRVAGPRPFEPDQRDAVLGDAVAGDGGGFGRVAHTDGTYWSG